MNKKDLVKRISEEVGISQVDAKKAIDIVLDEISDSVEKKQQFRMRGIKDLKVTVTGSFVRRDARTGRFSTPKKRAKAQVVKVADSRIRGGNTGGGGPGRR